MPNNKKELRHIKLVDNHMHKNHKTFWIKLMKILFSDLSSFYYCFLLLIPLQRFSYILHFIIFLSLYSVFHKI